MASTSETGHAKNIANLDKLIDFVTQLGATFNPTNPQITVIGLNNLKTQSTTDFKNWSSAFTAYKTNTNERELVFAPLKKLNIAISDNLKSLSIPQQTIDDVTAIISKITGNGGKSAKQKNVPPLASANPTTVVGDGSVKKSISTSQQSFDNITANFEKLIQQLLAIPTYAPNEVNIQTASLQALLSSMQTANLNAITATNAVNQARNQRNLTLYGDNTGLYDIVKKTKLYIRQIYGITSPQYSQVTAIKFVKIVPKKAAKKK